ncbi:type IV secretion system protein [Vibrio parahaemolyticus]
MNKPITLALSIALAFTVPANASGIPVVDVASVTQMVTDSVTRAKEFTQSITEARNRLNQMRNQAEHYKSMVEGHYGFEKILSDPNFNDVVDLSDYSDLYDSIEDVSDLREEFGLYSDNPITQRRYDMQLKQLKFQETIYERSTKRQERMSRLLSQFNTATTPAAKEDLGNAINFETTLMQNDQQMMTAMSEMLERQKVLERNQQARLNVHSMLYGKGISIK